jgi:hypothetical protein
MIYRVCEHYDDNQINSNSLVIPDECFICYEIRTNKENYPISLKSQINYEKSCGCDGWIHKQCFDIWYKKQKTCPVCRLEIHEKKNIACAVVNVSSQPNDISICKSLHKIAAIFVYSFLFCISLELYLSIVRTKQLNINNDENNNY